MRVSAILLLSVISTAVIFSLGGVRGAVLKIGSKAASLRHPPPSAPIIPPEPIAPNWLSNRKGATKSQILQYEYERAQWRSGKTRAEIQYKFQLDLYRSRLRPVVQLYQWTTLASTASAVAAAMAIAMMFLLFRRRSNFGDGYTHCGTCGYILKGLEEPRCPECGNAI